MRTGRNAAPVGTSIGAIGILTLLSAPPILAGEGLIFEDDFESAECSNWSSTTNPVAYPDLDEDSWGDTSQPTVYCQLPSGYVSVDGDCDDGQSAINPDADEVCDGLDNDCNAKTLDGDDEIWLGGACDGSDSDLCTDGSYVCASSSQFCSDSGEDNLEVCNGLDDDCDTVADNGFECVAESFEECGKSNVGECKYGTRTCSVSCSWGSCEGNVDPVPEICDNKDNNCDGYIDEDNPGGNADCDTGQPGVCSVGLTYCNLGSFICIQQNSPSPEICDDLLDNDCDGYTDAEDLDDCGALTN